MRAKQTIAIFGASGSMGSGKTLENMQLLLMQLRLKYNWLVGWKTVPN